MTWLRGTVRFGSGSRPGEPSRACRGRSARGPYVRNRLLQVADRHALQHAVAEGLVQPQPVEVDVADVATAGVVAARPLGQATLEIRGIQVADRRPNEVAAADRP